MLVTQVAELLAPSRNVLDCTVGGGGHAHALLERGVTSVTGVDRDGEAIAAARERLSAFIVAGRFRCHLGSYVRLDEIPALAGAMFDGILLDLGVSAHQIDEPTRGFTFREGAPLDMRMSGVGSAGEWGAPSGPSAADLLNTADAEDLASAFRDYADEPRAGRLGREIVRRRATRPFATSDDLVDAIRGALGPRTGPPDFARLFQAVRIAVNDELGGLERALPALRDRLEPLGVLAVIAYHSGEDRLAKHAFRSWSASCVCPPRQAPCTCRGRPLGETILRKGITASAEEIIQNPRSRSARLRAWRSAP